MTDPNFILLYVESPLDSAGFYARLLGKPAIEASPGFAMFALGSGVMLGLWKAADVLPPSGAGAAPIGSVPARGELAFAVADKAAVDSTCRDWQALGLPLLQAPTEMDFGYTFTAADPDGHRLRVFAPAAA